MTATASKHSSKLQNLHEFVQGLKSSFDGQHGHARQALNNKLSKMGDFTTGAQQFIAAAGLLGQVATGQPSNIRQVEKTQARQDNSVLLAVTQEERAAILEKMSRLTELPPGHLEKEDELYLEQQLSDMLGVVVTAQLEGQRLNHTLGIMGGEQHLKRFPTDTLDQHDAYQEAGMAPNRGAFGWFTQQGSLTKEAIEREKYYIAVQTLYLPNWNSEHKTLKPWYKFRKMIVVNPLEEVAVVAVVGDAGPALWVRKQFGGSPEVMREGKIWSKKAKGKVMVFFVDDPHDRVPLGPVSLQDVVKVDALADARLNK